MKVVVQIPVYNEAGHLPLVLQDLKKHFSSEPDIETETLLIDDGSSDESAEIARQTGIREIVSLGNHQGLGIAFKAGLRRALELNADIIINTDGDFQYQAQQIKRLITPLLHRQADMVIGDRQIARLPLYPIDKLISQWIGNFLTGLLLRCTVKDSTSGFRAFSRQTAQLLVEKLKNQYTYTLESICILRKYSKSIVYVPILINPPMRPSRLIKSKWGYVRNYLLTLIKSVWS